MVLLSIERVNMQLHTATPPTQLIFLAGMFDQTIHLLMDAQEYFTHYGPKDQQNVSPVERLVYSSEMSRITLRLSSVMAWLLARRAEYNGEITAEQAVRQFRLAFHEVCLKELPEMRYVLPEYMCTLLTRSLELYHRAARLDSLLAEQIATVH